MSRAQKINSKNVLSLPDGKYLIDPQLYLVVRRDGSSRSYILRYTIAGRRRDMSLGDPQVKPLAVVKQEAARARLQVSQGIDPKEEREQIRRSSKTPTVPLLKDFFPHAMDELASIRTWSPRTRVKYDCVARKYILPSPIIYKCLDQIQVSDIVDCLSEPWQKTYYGEIVRSLLEAVFRLARRDGLVSGANPALWRDNLDAYLPQPLSKSARTVHRYALSVVQLKDALRVGLSRGQLSDRLVAIIALTACRRDEIRFMKWSEVNFDTKTFSVPPERRKDRRLDPHVVPLSDQAVYILKTLTDQQNMTLGQTTLIASLKRSSKNIDATLHGLRSTFRDWCAETEQNPILAEKSLMHSTGSAVQLAYQRSDLLEQRRPLMQAWADTILPMDTLKEVLPESMNTPTEKY